MTPAPDALDRRRADLTAEIDHLTAYIEGEQQRLACLHAELRGHDNAVSMMRATLDDPEIAGPRRRDIAAEVYKVINAGPQTVSEIAREVGNVKLSAVDQAIRWHIEKGNIRLSVPLNGQARYVRAFDTCLQSLRDAALQEAAE